MAQNKSFFGISTNISQKYLTNILVMLCFSAVSVPDSLT